MQTSRRDLLKVAGAFGALGLVPGRALFGAAVPAGRGKPNLRLGIVGDAKRLVMLPGAVSGALVKPDFAFGPFREYIVEGKMPTDAQLAELQRRWDDVATVIELLAQSGIAELTDVQYQVADPKAAAQDAKGKKKAPQAKDKAKKPLSDISNPSAYTYVFSFTTKPAGFASVLNKLVTSERFIAVDGFTFSRARDALSEALGGEEKKDSAVAASGGRRGRRRGGAVQQEKKEDEAKKSVSKGIVTDPLLEEPVAVVLTVTVNDFHSLEERGDEATASAEKKGASK